MPPSISSPSLRIPVSPLTAEAFAPFGTVIENPLHYQSPGFTLPKNAVYANQGSALKILDVTHMTNFYSEAPSQISGKAVMNIFACSPRMMRQDGSTTPVSGVPVSFAKAFANSDTGGAAQPQPEYLFDVKILERHPFTSQTFIPMGLNARDETTCYLVIVAPTSPSTSSDRDNPETQVSSFNNFLARASPSLRRSSATPPSSTSVTNGQRKGAGQPDLQGIRAFIANGRQAVTYGAGTWHAPMVVLGMEKVEFVVVQFANGIGEEDCQERELKEGDGEEGISVVVKMPDAGSGKFGMESVKSKL